VCRSGTVNEPLFTLGPHTTNALPVLIEALKDPETRVRMTALMGLDRIRSPHAVPALAEMLGRETTIEMRAAILFALQQLAAEARPALPALLRVARQDDNSQLRQLALRTVERIDPETGARVSAELKAQPPPAKLITRDGETLYEGMPLAYWIDRLAASYVPNEIYGRSDRKGPAEAIRAFPSAQVVAELTRALQSSNHFAPPAAVDLLGQYGAEARSALPALVGALEHPSTGFAASGAIVAIAKAVGGVPPELTAALQATNPMTRMMAASTVARLEPANPLALPVFARALRQIRQEQPRGVMEPWMFYQVSLVLTNFSPPSTMLGSELVAYLAQGGLQPETRDNLLKTIGEFGVDESAVPQLLDAYLESSRFGRESPALERMIVNLGPPAMKAILERMHQPRDQVVWSKLISRFKGEAVPVLVPLLTGTNRWLRNLAGGALAGMGPDASNAVPTLIEQTRDPDAMTRSRAARILGSIGPSAEPALPALTALLEDPDPRVRPQATNAMNQLRR